MKSVNRTERLLLQAYRLLKRSSPSDPRDCERSQKTMAAIERWLEARPDWRRYTKVKHRPRVGDRVRRRVEGSVRVGHVVEYYPHQDVVSVALENPCTDRHKLRMWRTDDVQVYRQP